MLIVPLFKVLMSPQEFKDNIGTNFKTLFNFVKLIDVNFNSSDDVNSERFEFLKELGHEYVRDAILAENEFSIFEKDELEENILFYADLLFAKAENKSPKLIAEVMAYLDHETWANFAAKYAINCAELFADKKLLAKFFSFINTLNWGDFALFISLDTDLLFANSTELLTFIDDLPMQRRDDFVHQFFGFVKLKILLADENDLQSFIVKFPEASREDLRKFILIGKELTREQIFSNWDVHYTQRLALLTNPEEDPALNVYNNALMARTDAMRFVIISHYINDAENRTHPFYLNMQRLLSSMEPVAEQKSESSSPRQHMSF